MRNIKIVIEYDGTGYSGWQYQPDRSTVQGEIEAALKRMFRRRVRVAGSGRTDQGVHALGQVANFFVESRLPLDRIRNGLNALVPDDIHVRTIKEVDSDFHSRFSALGKVYQYQIVTEFSPVRRRFFWFVKHPLDLDRMSAAAARLKGRRDFRWFSVQGRGGKSTVCDVKDINLTKRGRVLIIKFEADRFLRQMVRGLVGFMVDVGRGRYSPGQAEQVLQGKIRGLYFAPPHGLFLMKVKY